MSVDDLAARNILKNSGMAPRLQAQTEELEKRRLAEKLNGRMSRRPDREELVRAGLIDKRNMVNRQIILVVQDTTEHNEDSKLTPMR